MSAVKVFKWCQGLSLMLIKDTFNWRCQVISFSSLLYVLVPQTLPPNPRINFKRQYKWKNGVGIHGFTPCNVYHKSRVFNHLIEGAGSISFRAISKLRLSSSITVMPDCCVKYSIFLFECHFCVKYMQTKNITWTYELVYWLFSDCSHDSKFTSMKMLFTWIDTIYYKHQQRSLHFTINHKICRFWCIWNIVLQAFRSGDFPYSSDCRSLRWN